MKYNDFKKILSSSRISGAYLFHGIEGLIADKTINYITNNYVSKMVFDLNYLQLHGKSLELQDIYSAIETLPFMSDSRVVVIDELQDMVQRIDFSDEFFKTLNSIPSDTIIIFYDSDQNLNKNTKLYKYFSKNNRNIDFQKLDNPALKNYVKSEAKARKKNISDSDIAYFLLKTGYQSRNLEINLYDLDSELKKLLNSTTGDIVTKQDIDSSVISSVDTNIFNLLTHLGEKNTEKSLSNLHDLYEANEPITIVLHMIQRRYRHLYEYISLRNSGRLDRDISNIMDLKSYEFKVISNLSYKYDICEVKDKLDEVMEVEISMKSSYGDELLLLEYLIVHLCN